jgi:hypothetical protein
MPIIATTHNCESKGPLVESRTITSTEEKPCQVVRGFDPNRISTFVRSSSDTTFGQDISTRTYKDGAIESDIKDNVEQSAIEEDGSDWEDDENEEGAIKFDLVDHNKNAKSSHRSLLTTAFREGDGTWALQNGASQFTSAIRRSRTTEPNGPSIGNSPKEDGLMMGSGEQKTKPIIMTTSNVHPPAMSIRTTRPLVFTQELQWEREKKNNTINAVAKCQQNAISPVTLRGAATTSNVLGTNGTTPFMDAKFNSLNYDVNSAGLDPYHFQGW